MSRKLLLVCFCALPALAAGFDPSEVLHGVERHYNRANSLEMAFTETLTTPGHPRRTESGELTLRKPGRMRWDYTNPPGKLFLSDGKRVYFYTPENHQVERMDLKDTEDLRAPLAFLLGKLDFSKEFKDIMVAPAEDGYFLTAAPKSDKLPYDRVEMRISPDYEIRGVVVHEQDGSVLSYQFGQEKLNPPVDAKLFHFELPEGATLVNGEASQ